MGLIDIGDILQNVANIQIQVNIGMPEPRKKFGNFWFKNFQRIIDSVVKWVKFTIEKPDRNHLGGFGFFVKSVL